MLFKFLSFLVAHSSTQDISHDKSCFIYNLTFSWSLFLFLFLFVVQSRKAPCCFFCG